MIKKILEWTAWPMLLPKPYGPFHMITAAAGLAAAFFTARFLARKKEKEKLGVILLLGVGLLLTFMEVYKQLFLYEIVNDKSYDWWYFPFQLCSLPLYLCPLMVFCQRKKADAAKAIGTFMMDFNLLGGVMALAEPSGLMHPYITLTMHGFLWHILIIWIGWYIGMSGMGSMEIRGFLKTLPIFGISVGLATLFNVAFHGYGEISMFYISPYDPSTQAVFHSIAARWGTAVGIAAYLAAMCIGAFIIHCLWAFLYARRHSKT